MPNGANTRKPEQHENTCNVNWNGDTIVFRAEYFDGDVDKNNWDEIGSKTNSLRYGIVDGVQGRAAVAKPSDYEKEC